MSNEVDVVMKPLQTKGLTLADCPNDLDTLTVTIQEERSKHGSNLNECRLVNELIDSKANIVHSPDFELSILKIQEDVTSQLTSEEERAVRLLKSKSISAADVCLRI